MPGKYHVRTNVAQEALELSTELQTGTSQNLKLAASEHSPRLSSNVKACQSFTGHLPLPVRLAAQETYPRRLG